MPKIVIKVKTYFRRTNTGTFVYDFTAILNTQSRKSIYFTSKDQNSVEGLKHTYLYEIVSFLVINNYVNIDEFLNNNVLIRVNKNNFATTSSLQAATASVILAGTISSN